MPAGSTTTSSSTTIVSQNLKPRYGLFPIRHQEIWTLHDLLVSKHWKADEINYGDILAWYESLSKEEQDVIDMILAFFSEADGIVGSHISRNMAELCDAVPEIAMFEGQKAGNECVHRVVYAKIIDVVISDPIKKEKLFNAIESFPCVQKKAAWILGYKDDPQFDIGEKIFAMVLGEMLQFSASFAIPDWYRANNVDNGFTHSNHLISADEGLHGRAGITYLNYFGRGDNHGEQDLGIKIPSQERAHKMVKEVVEIECEFVDTILGKGFVGLTTEMMHQYIKVVADGILVALDYEKIYNETNPFNFIDTTALMAIGNFFETKTAEYEHADIINLPNEVFRTEESATIQKESRRKFRRSEFVEENNEQGEDEDDEWYVNKMEELANKRIKS